MTIHRRLPPDARRAAILEAAVQLAADLGYRALTCELVAEAVGVSRPLISHYFHHADLLREEVMVEAVKLELLGVIAAGLVEGSDAAHAAPQELKQRAVDHLVLGGIS